jgi:hypothetical protein
LHPSILFNSIMLAWTYWKAVFSAIISALRTVENRQIDIRDAMLSVN